MKFVQEHCSICNRDMAMPVVQEDENHPGLIWVRCPECHEIKPIDIAPDAKILENDEDVPPRGKGDGRDNDSRRTVRHYRAGERFVTGEWIYHPGWDDTGQVIEKCCSKGGREIIVVCFRKMGTRRLVSNFAS